MATDRAAIIDALAALGTSESESFLEHGLGAAFAQPNKGWGRRKRVNEALLAAERRGDINEILEDARRRFVETDTNPQPVTERPVARSQRPTSKRQVFISHAEADKHIAEAVQDLLRLGTNMSAENVFCSSLPGLGVPIGTGNYNGHIRERLNGAKLVIPVITPAFMESTMCLIELGGVWGAGLRMFPIIVPPVTYAQVEAGIGKTQMATIDSDDALGQLHDAILESMDLTGKTDMWNQQQAKFLKKVPGLLGKLAQPKTVASTVHVAALKKVETLTNDLADAREAETKLKERFDEVAALKDADEVAATAPPSTTVEAFEAALSSAQGAVYALPSVVRLGTFTEFGRGEEWRPDHDEWGKEIERAEQSELIIFQEDGNYYYLNQEEPLVEAARQAIDDLFELEVDDDFEDWFKATYGRQFRRSNLQVWEQLDLF